MPPPDVFQLVRYASPVGDLAAYVSVHQADDKKRPAIIWIVGGFPPGGFGIHLVSEAPTANDQTAQAYRKADVLTLFPSFRGAFGNPGLQESFYGEVDDVIAALSYLKARNDVDPERVFLGGHSTSATLALLAAAATDEFAGVFAFGPVSDPLMYGEEALHFDPADHEETRRRAPIHYLDSIRSETYVIEGEYGNIMALRGLELVSNNTNLKFVQIAGADHFQPLAPLNALLAESIAGSRSGQRLGLEPAKMQASYSKARP
ncbi:MAG: prolyl oligopeptidase family serine peptidase [Myxococcota bacterium]